MLSRRTNCSVWYAHKIFDKHEQKRRRKNKKSHSDAMGDGMAPKQTKERVAVIDKRGAGIFSEGGIWNCEPALLAGSKKSNAVPQKDAFSAVGASLGTGTCWLHRVQASR